MAQVPVCGIEVNEFNLQIRDYVLIQINIPCKGTNLFILSASV